MQQQAQTQEYQGRHLNVHAQPCQQTLIFQSTQSSNDVLYARMQSPRLLEISLQPGAQIGVMSSLAHASL